MAEPLWKRVIEQRTRSHHVAAFLIAFFNPTFLSVPYLNEPDDAPLRQLFRTIVDFATDTRKHMIVKLVSRCIR